MKRLLPVLAVLALAGCARFDATVAPQGVPDRSSASSVAAEPADPAQPYETEMLACRPDGACAQHGVLRNAFTVMSMRNDEGSWMGVTASECVDATCTATDEFGVEWMLAK
jgi:hypothetical protein